MSPVYTRMLVRSFEEVAPPSYVPGDFTATLQCPSGDVLLEWSNDGYSETKVLEYSKTGSSGWTQIATPGTVDTSYLHESIDKDPEQSQGYWRIRFSTQSEWANTSEFLECPE